MRINNDGTYEYCRWVSNRIYDTRYQITKMTPMEYFQQHLRPLRQQMLDGHAPEKCGPCYRMEMHDKISGRQKQLLKIGVQQDHFIKTMQSSPWINEFKTDGSTDLMPQDWQIDLGNHCNSACVFCDPRSSSRLATEFKQIGLIDQLPPDNWSNNPESMERFLDSLRASPHIRYIHFIGGETLITPAFKQILTALIDTNLNQSVTIGFTTNLTVWNEEILDLLKQFDKINLGASVECFHETNDYARWPSKIAQVESVLSQWLEIAQHCSWYVQLRVTPTLLTIGHLISVYEYALKHGLAVESCNFLENPSYLRPSVLPPEYRTAIIEKLEQWIKNYDTSETAVINTRNPDFAKVQVLQDAASYVSYLKGQQDESHRLPDLVRYLRLIDDHRGISVLDYLPEYEKLFRSAGY